MLKMFISKECLSKSFQEYCPFWDITIFDGHYFKISDLWVNIECEFSQV